MKPVARNLIGEINKPIFIAFNNIKGKNALLPLLILVFLSVSSCGPFVTPAADPDAPEEPDWIIPEGPVQELRELTWDLHHQKLWVRFNFEREQVIGQTEMLFTSDMKQDELIFDAKTMEFDSVYDVRSNQKFEYRQDSAIVTVDLGSEFEEGDTLVLGIDFVSSPPERGLYFVNPRGEDPVKPTQVWTLGQPEDNSFWFPTIDHPAERATQETWITVPPHFETLSNGLMKESRMEPGDSLRTDYWRLNQPHTPYLFVLAVGEYDIVEELEGDILYRYYVEPEFAPTVDRIYENTADMILYSEKKTGIAYPWDPVYSQAPVHDFIARGMENTTATLLYDAVQFDERAARDLSNQDLIMHEIIHQWLGNLVTAKNWANLPLNEGFANYFESSYRLHNNGRDSYLWKNQNDRITYFNEAEDYRRPVIFNQYQVPEDMYDRHTYQKSGQILRMLHDYLGDDTWWEAVRTYVEKFSFDAVDVYDLQQVYEDVSETDLDWFFEQWFHEPGHPSLEKEVSIRGNSAEMTVYQVQDTARQPVYRLHPEVLIKTESDSFIEEVKIEEMVETFSFEADSEITDVILDPDRVQLAEYYIDPELDQIKQRLGDDRLLVRSEALALLPEYLENADVREIIARLAREDDFWGIRMTAFELVSETIGYFTDRQAFDLALHAVYDNEKRYEVRSQALEILPGRDLDDEEMRLSVQEHLVSMMEDTSYFVSADAIVLTGELFPEDAAELAAVYKGQSSYQNVIKNAVADALIMSDTDESREMLMLLAEEPGDVQYSYEALSHLSALIPEMDETMRQEIQPLFMERIGDPYAKYRMLAYQAVVALGVIDAIDDLEQAAGRDGISEEEKSEIKRAIRVLEFERNELDG